MKLKNYAALPFMGVVAFGVSLVAAAAPAQAQATRTWVSGVGDDVNPCSRTAPCKTFAGAISKTAAGGEINCLDPGGFGAVSITKSMTISCPYTEGGALAGGNGITINDGLSATPGTAVVYLRGLDIFGVNPPTNGVRFIRGAALHIEDSVIRRFNAANSVGVSFAPATSGAELYISDSTIAENGSGGTGGGIEIKPGVGGFAQAIIKNVRVHNNANNGIKADSTNGLVALTIEDSSINGNGSGLAAAGTVHNSIVMVNDTVFTNNIVVGIGGNGGTVAIRVDNSTITGNTVGVSAVSGASIFSYGGNRLDANPTTGALNNGAFTGAIILRK
jgi:hypothetical protein